jgi:3-hydroxybutyryl-CoA dehydrogenase
MTTVVATGKIAVIGGGTMGNGIAQVFAAHGNPVTLVEISQTRLDAATKAVDKSLARMVKKEKIDEATKKAVLEKITGTTSLTDVGDAELVIEAVIEDFDTKHKIFEALDGTCPEQTIFASNTSSISITELAAVTKRPDRFIGMHFMNPVPMMALVEVVRGLATSDDTCAKVSEYARELGKTPIEVHDSPGFVSNRVLLPMINEAIYCLYEGVGTREAIDGVMKLGMAHPMGPLALADLIGLDVCLDIMNVLHMGFSDSKYRPCPLLKKMVAAGHLGRKAGRGFYEYE